MIPKPPFAATLSLEDELSRFEALKPRLASVWHRLTASEEADYTSVVVPSLTLDQGELAKLDGAAHYEERLLSLLIRLRNPRAHMVYVTSQPLHPQVLELYLQLLVGIPASHARQRLTMICAHDTSPRSLTEKILERPRLIERIRCAIRDPSKAYLTVFNATPLERKLAVLLDIPMNGCDPSLGYLGTKSGGRKVLREAGVPVPAGFEDLSSVDDVARAIAELGSQNPLAGRVVIKLNEGFSGEGNAILRLPDERSLGAVRDALTSDLAFVGPGETPDGFFTKFARMGGIVEEFIEAPRKASPSVQVRTSPDGEVVLISTHDQILGGESGQVFLGARFPADAAYRGTIQDAGLRVGEVLARRGVVSRFAVDFIAAQRARRGPWQVSGIESNLRMGGTTHPFLALQFLTGGQLDPVSGLFKSQSGRQKCYRATDNLRSPAYRGLLPEDLIDILTVNKLHYSERTESGVLFHMIGALSEFGKLGLTAIANSPEEADRLYDRVLEVLADETRYGREAG
ncbi:MAG: carboxylate-amine ligase [Gemmatimonadetes bacterium]|nr:carboxylate-amine ligase [Gemmatimonadota bacterium]